MPFPAPFLLIGLIALIFAAIVPTCLYLNKTPKDEVGRVDSWTWDAPLTKSCTSPDRTKRVRADIEHGNLILKFGESSQDHPLDIMIHVKEVYSTPTSDSWHMEWLDNERFTLHHPDLGSRMWKVIGDSTIYVSTLSDWGGGHSEEIDRTSSKILQQLTLLGVDGVV
jgi:hypothetical protein